MKHKRYTEEQIIGMLKEHEAGARMPDLARRHGVSEQTLCRWKNKYGGMDISEAWRLRELEQENAKLKLLLADAELDKAALKEILSKMYGPLPDCKAWFETSNSCVNVSGLSRVGCGCSQGHDEIRTRGS